MKLETRRGPAVDDSRTGTGPRTTTLSSSGLKYISTAHTRDTAISSFHATAKYPRNFQSSQPGRGSGGHLTEHYRLHIPLVLSNPQREMSETFVLQWTHV